MFLISMIERSSINSVPNENSAHVRNDEASVSCIQLQQKLTVFENGSLSDKLSSF